MATVLDYKRIPRQGAEKQAHLGRLGNRQARGFHSLDSGRAVIRFDISQVIAKIWRS